MEQYITIDVVCDLMTAFNLSEGLRRIEAEAARQREGELAQALIQAQLENQRLKYELTGHTTSVSDLVALALSEHEEAAAKAWGP